MLAMEALSFADNSRWFVVFTKPRAETHAEEHLNRQSFTTYLPRIQQLRPYKGRWKEMTSPLFPRYLFVRLIPGVEDVSPIRSTRGVSGLVSFGGQLAVMPQGVVEALRACEDPTIGAHTLERSPFNRGDRIRIVQGAFAGLEGIFHVPTGEERVIILLNVLGRDASPVTLPLSDIEPVLNDGPK